MLKLGDLVYLILIKDVDLKLDTKPKFFCESCGAEVKQNDRICSSCGRFFSAVKCPSCGYSGSTSSFSNGCPVCGYSRPKDGFTLEQYEKFSKPKVEASPLPLWVYILTLAIVTLAILGIVSIA